MDRLADFTEVGLEEGRYSVDVGAVVGTLSATDTNGDTAPGNYTITSEKVKALQEKRAQRRTSSIKQEVTIHVPKMVNTKKGV